FILPSFCMPHAGQNFAMLTPMGVPTGVRVGGADQSTGLRLAMGRHAPPKRPTSSSIGPEMRAPRQMNGNVGLSRVTTPAKVKKAPTSTWRRIKGSPRDCIVWGRHEASEVTARTGDARAISDFCAAPTPLD